ncbi:hypothetical protein [Pseudonocardia sp. T1-2H]|uniref:hypothetical protein n=1 Tax=Pseudonocardia sp. T1-2H TaxID=3128899 RepID=UPI003100CA24
MCKCGDYRHQHHDLGCTVCIGMPSPPDGCRRFRFDYGPSRPPGAASEPQVGDTVQIVVTGKVVQRIDGRVPLLEIELDESVGTNGDGPVVTYVLPHQTRKVEP